MNYFVRQGRLRSFSDHLRSQNIVKNLIINSYHSTSTWGEVEARNEKRKSRNGSGPPVRPKVVP